MVGMTVLLLNGFPFHKVNFFIFLCLLPEAEALQALFILHRLPAIQTPVHNNRSEQNLAECVSCRCLASPGWHPEPLRARFALTRRVSQAVAIFAGLGSCMLA